MGSVSPLFSRGGRSDSPPSDPNSRTAGDEVDDAGTEPGPVRAESDRDLLTGGDAPGGFTNEAHGTPSPSVPVAQHPTTPRTPMDRAAPAEVTTSDTLGSPGAPPATTTSSDRLPAEDPSTNPAGLDGASSPPRPADVVAHDEVDVPAGTTDGQDDHPAVAVDLGVDLPRPAHTRVIAIANQKGGVGKTTTTVNLGASLAERGLRTLVVDLDPQGNASTGLGLNIRDVEATMYEVILESAPIEDSIEATSVRNLFVAPASLDLAGAEIELVSAFSRELRLRTAIEQLDGQFDYVLIDCPPSLGLLTVNGLAAAQEVLVPIQCEYYALEGLGQLLRNVELVRKNLNASLEVRTIVLVMYDARTTLSADVAAEVRSHFDEKVATTVIPRTVRLSEAPSFGQPITVFDGRSRGATAYRSLAQEVSDRGPAPLVGSTTPT